MQWKAIWNTICTLRCDKLFIIVFVFTPFNSIHNHDVSYHEGCLLIHA